MYQLVIVKSDIQMFWKLEFTKLFKLTFPPVMSLLRYWQKVVIVRHDVIKMHEISLDFMVKQVYFTC